MHPYIILALILFSCFARELMGSAKSSRLALNVGDEIVKISNKHIQMEIIKSSGAIKKLLFKNTDLIGSGSGYMQSNDQNGFMTPKSTQFTIIRNDHKIIDIAFAHQHKFAVDYEFHYVLRPGDCGFYNYIIWGSKGNQAKEQNLSQLNYALRLNPNLFTHYSAISGIAALPKIQDLNESTQVMDATFKTKDGNIYTKYNHAATMDETHNVHGLLSKKFGAWVIMPSHEHLNGAPFNTELTLHQTKKSPILLRHVQAAHHGSGTVKFCHLDGPWEKWGGPWFFHFNHGGSMKRRTQEAKELANQMSQDWPFDWIKDDRFKSTRGTLRGQIIDQNGLPVAGARIVIAKSIAGENPTDFQQHWKGYRFFGWTDNSGYFKLKNVWPDTYDLFAMKNDISGRFIQHAFKVNMNETTDVGQLNWNTPALKKRLWQIGTLDRSASEFAYGQDYRHWGLWIKIAEKFPDQVIPIDADSGDPRDMPFILAAFNKANGKAYNPELQIDFELNQIPNTQTVNLHIAIADAIQHRGKIVDLEIFINESQVATTNHAFQHGGAIHRSGIRGLCQEINIPFHSKYLKVGTNTLKIRFQGKQNINKTPTGAPNVAVMWDAIRLEIN